MILRQTVPAETVVEADEVKVDILPTSINVKVSGKAGRPTVMTDDVLAKLEDAFTWGHTEVEACLLVNIDESTLWRYCEKNPDFAKKKELLKNTPTLKARRTLVKAMQEDPELALKYLERKKKDEFSLRSELDMLVAVKPIPILGGLSKDPGENKGTNPQLQ